MDYSVLWSLHFNVSEFVDPFDGKILVDHVWR